jgi:putative protein-disulfide isomerase
VIEALREDYRHRAKVALVLGGLRPGTREPMAPSQREEILHHWHAVHERTGQPFAFDGALPAGFIYDTEPASRAVVAVSEVDPAHTFAMFKSVQQAFYAERQDVTRTPVLAELAARQGIESAQFLNVFRSEEAKRRTLAHFHQAREWGVRGFPTLILQNEAGYTLLTSGWRPLAELRLEVERALG